MLVKQVIYFRRLAEPVHTAITNAGGPNYPGLPREPHCLRNITALPSERHLHRPKCCYHIRRGK